jgi:hypothetical protein
MGPFSYAGPTGEKGAQLPRAGVLPLFFDFARFFVDSLEPEPAFLVLLFG